MSAVSEPTHEEALDDWYKKTWLYRIFLPGDFFTQATEAGKEKLTSEKQFNQRLEMQDSVQRHTLKIREAKQYSADFNYRPVDFKKTTLKLIGNSAIVMHRACGGSGVLDCPAEMDCRTCNGRGRRDENCDACHGDGQVRKNDFEPDLFVVDLVTVQGNIP